MEANFNNPKNLLNEPPQFPEEPEPSAKKQALTNLGIFLTIFIILLMGVKFATWSASKWSDAGENQPVQEEVLPVTEEDLSAEKERAVNEEKELEQTASVSNIVAGTGEVVFNVSSRKDTVIREIFLHNPYKNSWLQVYDGYRNIGNTPSVVYRLNLLPIKYDKIRVRTLEEVRDLEQEVDITDGASTNVFLEL